MKFFQIIRRREAVAVWITDDGKRFKKVFPATVTDAEIRADILGEEPPKKVIVEEPKKEPVPAPETDNKSVLRAHYLEFLKDKGIDMTTERSFRKIEEAYKENGGK